MMIKMKLFMILERCYLMTDKNTKDNIIETTISTTINTLSTTTSDTLAQIDCELEELQNDFVITKGDNKATFNRLDGEISNIKSCCDIRFNYLKSEMEDMEDKFTESIRKLTKFTYISLSSLLIFELIPLIMIFNS